MKRAMLAIACVIVASPIFAQEVDLGLGGDASSLLNLPAPRGNTPARGTSPVRGDGTSRGAGAPAVDRLVRLRELFVGANVPLAKEQEAALNSFLNAEIPAMRRTLQERIAELEKTRGSGASPRNLPSMDELAPEIIRLNDQLLGKIAAAPGLNPQQQAFVKKLYQDQVKSRGGFDAIKLTLEIAGVPLSAEQIVQIQPLLDEQNQAKLQLLKESRSPDKMKIDQLQRQTLAKVIKLLTATQRSALVAK
jgi:hypothetical protein